MALSALCLVGAVLVSLLGDDEKLVYLLGGAGVVCLYADARRRAVKSEKKANEALEATQIIRRENVEIRREAQEVLNASQIIRRDQLKPPGT